MEHEGIFEEITDNELPSQIDNFHFLENQLRAVLPMRILQLLHNYFRKCLEHNPHIRFDGGLENSVAATIFLYWLISGSSFRRIASLTGYPQSNVNRLCATLVPFLSTFGKKYVDSGTFEERDTARRKFKHKVAPYLKHVTLIVDATVIPIKKFITEPYNGPSWVWCAKNKCSGYKVTAAIDLSGIFRFVSAVISGSNHDIECFRQQKVEFEKTISKRDQIVGDAAYQSLKREASVGKWHIKLKAAKNRPLSKEDEKRNSEIEVIRSHIEKSFGYLKQIFETWERTIDVEESGFLPLFFFVLESQIWKNL
jgi:hypothetical protein